MVDRKRITCVEDIRLQILSMGFWKAELSKTFNGLVVGLCTR